MADENPLVRVRVPDYHLPITSYQPAPGICPSRPPNLNETSDLEALAPSCDTRALPYNGEQEVSSFVTL